jgi:hypothetical protein
MVHRRPILENIQNTNDERRHLMKVEVNATPHWHNRDNGIINTNSIKQRKLINT